MKRVILLLIGLVLCIFSLKAQFNQSHLQGHRGAKGYYPENQLGGMKHALEMGLRTLELDVVISKDLEVIVSHEPWMSSTICLDSNNSIIPASVEHHYNIFKMLYEEIVLFDCGDGHKPKLWDLLQALEGFVQDNHLSAPYYNVEIKYVDSLTGIFHPGIEQFCQLVIDVLKSHLPLERFNIQCFDKNLLKYLHWHHPEITLSFLYSEYFTLETVFQELGFIPPILSPYYKMVDTELVDACKINQVKIIPWTVNDKEEAIRLLNMGVYQVITDFPDLLQTQ
jgi:glycerophosphoryl diester phosphodiesterase